MTVDESIQQLAARPKGFRCKELLALLDRLGFRVKHGSKGGHKTYSHPALRNWAGGNFNCGHSESAMVLPIYTRKILAVLEEHKDSLNDFLYGRSSSGSV